MTVDYYWFALYVAFNSLLLLLLGLNVSRLRISLKIASGDGDNKSMRQAIRAHGNGVEHSTILGLGILALTFLGANDTLLAVFVLAFIVARVAHAWGMLSLKFMARRFGAALTFVIEAAVIVVLFSMIA